MQLLSVDNLPLSYVTQASPGFFDLAIFAAGYESRSTALFRRSKAAAFRKAVVFSFAEAKTESTHADSCKFYSKLHDVEMVQLKGGDDQGVYTVLRKLCSTLPRNRVTKVLIDYSSMSRVWYGAILNFFRYTGRQHPVELYFSYLQGLHKESSKAVQVEVIGAVPGYEGIAAASGRSTAVFALGFDPWCAYAVLERIEPDEIVVLLGARPDDPRYLEMARALNEDFIENEAKGNVITLPTLDTQRAFKVLCELAVLDFSKATDITFVGLGPKPHILAMLLTAIRFPKVAIVQARGKFIFPPQDVTATKQGVCSKIVFVPDMGPT